MKQGKQTCKILKEIRKQIAEANDIEFITSECQYQGDCLGTCPKCEAEVRYLEQQLERKRVAGKAIAILGISAGVMAMAPLISCTNATNKATTKEVAKSSSSNQMNKETFQKVDDDTLTNTKVAISICGLIPNDETPMSEKIIADNDTLYMVEHMPTFPGGMEGLMEFINNTISYSRTMKKRKLQGRVIVQFVINKEGSILDPQIVRGIHPILDKEALRIVEKMPKWNPGMQNGKTVNVRFTVPIMFRLP